MKYIAFILLLIFLSGPSMAQTKKITVYCHIDESGNVDYRNLPRLLPDSLQPILIYPRKEYNLSQLDDVLLGMSLNGWKLVSIAANASGGGGDLSIATSMSYLMSKEITLDDAARALFTEALRNVETKGK